MRLPVDGRDPQVVLPPLSRALRIEVDVEDGRVLAVRGDRNHVVSQGYLCVKGRELAEQHTHPARIRGARKRMPDGGFADIDFIYGGVETTTDVLPGVVSMAHARGGEPEPSVPSYRSRSSRAPRTATATFSWGPTRRRTRYAPVRPRRRSVRAER